MKRCWSIVVLSLSLVVLSSSCRRDQKPQIKEPDSMWQKFISGHTAGVISKRAKIQIQFALDVFAPESVGQSAQPAIDISPSIEGEVTVSDTRQIVIVPKNDLKQGQYYVIRVKAKKFPDLPQDIGDYEFVVQVLKQAYEVTTTGLTLNPSDDKVMELRGMLVTADVDDSEKMEKVVSAKLGGEDLKITWTHDLSGLKHEFVVAGITRKETADSLMLSWNGDPIGVDRKGEQAIEVPALSDFKITDLLPIQDERQYIQVYFSDKLDASQNLKGLVRVEGNKFTTRIEQNTIKIYPEKRFVGKISVTIDPAIKNERGRKLKEAFQKTIVFTSEHPQVRFVGKGVILPSNEILKIPFESMNVHSVQVTAFKVFENNIGQFLQVNKLDGSDELTRVGRFLWRKTIHLSALDPDKWQRFDLDATQLAKDHPGAILRMTLSINRSNSSYSCSEEENKVEVVKEKATSDNDDLYVSQYSNWEYAEDYYGQNYDNSNWNDRGDPCKDAYYQYGQGVSETRNFLASNIGLLAKKGQTDKLSVVATNLQTAEPLDGVELSVMNFQNQPMVKGVTNGDGLAEFDLKGTPFYISAQRRSDIGYLKINAGSALPVSHFDVGGETVQSGIKGTIYGERGVWRPGDDIFLVLAIEDKNDVIPAEHPVTMSIYNPQGQLIQSQTNTKPVGDFYRFNLKTSEDAPTGNWMAKAQLGSRTFTKTIKVETVIPNRLKLELDLGGETIHAADMPLKGKIFSQWLHGAKASGLKSDVLVKFDPSSTKFDRFADYVFDDPVRRFQSEEKTVFEGNLDAEGNAQFPVDLSPGDNAPGLLNANFTSRVFEGGGAFSVNRQSFKFYPYKNYVGIKLPKGDQARQMILTDKKHVVQIGTLNSKGNPVSVKNIKVKLYKVDWRWWWDKTDDQGLAQFENSQHTRELSEGTVTTVDGKGQWEFEVKYPDWGRYMVRACDEDGGHCTGQTLYIDWPGWAGRAQEEGGPAANVLQFYSDKTEYQVGETATIQLPEASQGRALVTMENGSRVLESRWVEMSSNKTSFTLPMTAVMTPNVYVSVTLLQPHKDKNNDRPIRLYGVIPLSVKDPKTMLEPVIKAKDEWAPESKVEISVSEANKRPMTYTVAIVDEGLLGLTNFKTPNLHDFFYRKEALGVTTWDLFDFVAGAYGGELDRLLALGGDDEADQQKNETERRFPPVVRFLGPFHLESGDTNKHEVDLPAYVGAVRVMVVAGERGAYGRSDKTVTVKEDLTLLTTLPRVVSPTEKITVPVSVFTAKSEIKDVTVSIKTDSFFKPVGETTVSVNFPKPGEKMAFFEIMASSAVGQGSVEILAESGGAKSRSQTFLSIRSPNPMETRRTSKMLEPQASWSETVTPHGLLGTNQLSLEVTSIPPLDLERRLTYLIQYPHGCVEQVTSSVFPQLYLEGLATLDEKAQKEIEKNVTAGIDRLRSFQIGSGGFVYWPGGMSGQDGGDLWASNYAGHFLVEAQKKGFYVPAEMISDWTKFQRSRAQAWTPNNTNYYHGGSALDQSYRLYTLALVGSPETGAMNRLREEKDLPDAARWQLAAAYQLAGQTDAALDVASKAGMKIFPYSDPGFTYGSDLRDRAIVLNAMGILRKFDEGKSLADHISSELVADRWQSTQSLAYTLMAMASFFGADGSDTSFDYSYTVGTGRAMSVNSKKSVSSIPMADFPVTGESVSVTNQSGRRLFAAVISKGIPGVGSEAASSNGLSLKVDYTDAKGNPIDVSSLAQGSDLIANVHVKNLTSMKIENIALSHLAASGWEIHNPRFDASAPRSIPIDYQDIRDDRVLSYFALKPGDEIAIPARFNASYLGRFYMPGISVEAMYDATKEASTKGQWITVSKSKK